MSDFSKMKLLFHKWRSYKRSWVLIVSAQELFLWALLKNESGGLMWRQNNQTKYMQN